MDQPKQNNKKDLKSFLNEISETKNEKTYTKGNIIVEDIKIGDIHYEFGYGIGMKVEVISLPIKKDNCFVWQSKNLTSGKIIDYAVDPEYSHYGPNIYDSIAYTVTKWI